jgi:hypothetical protein
MPPRKRTRKEEGRETPKSRPPSSPSRIVLLAGRLSLLSLAWSEPVWAEGPAVLDDPPQRVSHEQVGVLESHRYSVFV